MHVHLTAPLLVRTVGKVKLELLPVPMGNAFPSRSPELFVSFLKPQGKRMEIDATTAAKVQQYMHVHETEALTEDAVTAFTIAGDALVQCDPAVCGPAAGLTAI